MASYLGKQEKVLKAYEKRSAEIIQNMLSILMRAQRKVDDKAYRKTLEKMK